MNIVRLRKASSKDKAIVVGFYNSIEQEEPFSLKREKKIANAILDEACFIILANRKAIGFVIFDYRFFDQGWIELIILDEAYITFVDNPWSSLDMAKSDNLLILRSMTKDYALAGLRLGYGVASQHIIDTLSRIRPPWNVNAVAQQAGIIALKEKDYISRCQIKIKEAKDYLTTELSSLGLPPLPSEAGFFLVKVDDSPDFRQRLLEQKILVRDCTSFGLPGYIRIAPRTPPECQRLIEAIKKIRGT